MIEQFADKAQILKWVAEKKCFLARIGQEGAYMTVEVSPSKIKKSIMETPSFIGLFVKMAGDDVVYIKGE